MAIYAVSDLHGRMDLFRQIKDFIKPEDSVYVLGDCGDRGPAGWELIKAVYQDPQFIYLMGNHEDMLADAMVGDRQPCFLNGGKDTFRSWKYRDDGSKNWYKRLKSLPKVAIYNNSNGKEIILCHAGYTPSKYSHPTRNDYIWDRTHFNDPWEGAEFNNTYIIHGHTPTIYMLRDYGITTDKNGIGALWYSPDKDGVYHKCNIDCGAVFNGYTVLLNLDTFEEHLFAEEDCFFYDLITATN